MKLGDKYTFSAMMTGLAEKAIKDADAEYQRQKQIGDLQRFTSEVKGVSVDGHTFRVTVQFEPVQH